MDTETWKFINTFAPWFSALGTFAAVVVSLYLASRDRQVKLKVSAGLRSVATLGQPRQEKEEYVVISATNFSRREVTLTNIGWKIGLFRKKYLVQLPAGHPLSSKIPVRLRDGEEASYFLPITDSDNWLERFSRNHLGSYPR